MSADNHFKLSIVMPVFNEINTIDTIIKKVLNTHFSKELIIIDDGSEDGTREYLKKLEDSRIQVIYHEKNMGKGAALQTGFSRVKGDLVIIQDADLEYDPGDYGKLIQPILLGYADVVYGSRFLGGPHRVLFFWHYLANKFLTTISNVFTNINLSDMETCYKVFKSEVAKKLNLQSQSFGVEPEITAKIVQLKCRIYEVPISYFGRDYSEGKKIKWTDGFIALWAILKYNVFKKIS